MEQCLQVLKQHSSGGSGGVQDASFIHAVCQIISHIKAKVKKSKAIQ
jgi:hypothetical protein